MNARRYGIPTLALVLGASFGITQDEEQLEKRVETLEQKLEAVETYLQAQAKTAGQFSKALDQSEEQGFTWGINPDSRETLLGAFRDQVTSIQKDVPGAKTAEEEKVD